MAATASLAAVGVSATVKVAANTVKYPSANGKRAALAGRPLDLVDPKHGSRYESATV
jgi:hypothetical protein